MPTLPYDDTAPVGAPATASAGRATMIALQARPDCFLQMSADGIHQWMEHGGGSMLCHYGASAQWQFNLEPHGRDAKGNDVVAIGSREYPGVYLRLDGRHVPHSGPGGIANCQYGAGDWERFAIEHHGDGTVSLASVAFPGVYLRADAKGVDQGDRLGGVVDASRSVGGGEKFVLIDAPVLSGEAKLQAMADFAPMVVLALGEEYNPSSVEFAFQNMNRFRNDDDGGRYWIRTNQTLDSPSDDSPKYFRGQSDLRSVPAYAFWVDKPGLVTDIVYFFFFPYNRGKSVLKTIWGNHVSDWEHLTVRLQWAMKDGVWRPTPLKVALSAHDGGEQLAWSDIGKFVPTTHPVVYSAKGSHGIWSQPGDHVYKNYGVVKLIDECSDGALWNTWENLAAFDYIAREGINQPWPTWMSTDFKHAGTNPSKHPANGPIYRWGNESRGCADVPVIGKQCRLENGPEGPASKDVWKPWEFE